MKDLKIYLSVCILLSIVFSSCKEEPPYINYTKPQSVFDTTYIKTPVDLTQPKEILIEDVSGPVCPNCPQAALIAKTLENANPGRINVVTLYPNYPGLESLMKPINKPGYISKYDFRTNDAADIISSYPAAPSTLPVGYINRKNFSGNFWFEPKENWNGDVASELTATAPLNIEIVPTYNSSNNLLNVNVTVNYTKADSGSNYISVMILQDSIIDVQETKDANNFDIYDSVYIHNHTLMDMLTAHTGDLLNNTPAKTLVPGRVFKIGYQKTLSARNSSPSSYPQPQWDPKQISILVFVTQDVTKKYVLQSKLVHLP